MKKIVILALAVLALNSLKAQQDPQYTQWMYDKLSFNPAFAGFGCDDCFGAGGHAITLLIAISGTASIATPRLPS